MYQYNNFLLQFVRQGLEEPCQETSPFLKQSPLDNLVEIVNEITKVSEDLIVNGLNIHNYNIILLSESFDFYEEVYTKKKNQAIRIFFITFD